ncbi:MAG: hypothetical protein JWP74_3677, partial [Marmoricola sp.]|nr:hypothetical protein [Marmoricola sp.]
MLTQRRTVAVPRSRRVLRGVALSFVVGLLTLVMPFTTTPAQASILGDLGSAALAFGESLAAPAAEEVGADILVGGICSTGIGCALIAGGALLLTALYSPRDSWLPTLPGLLDQPQHSDVSGTTPYSGCQVTNTWTIVPGTASTFGGVSGQMNWTGCPAAIFSGGYPFEVG